MTMSEAGAALLARAGALAPEVEARADEIEAARRLPPDLAARLGRDGFYRIWVPARLGGLELPPRDGLEALEALAGADGSTAWCAFIGATSAVVLSYLDDAAAREIFARPETLLAGAYAPRGTAEAEAGGHRVHGRWAWGSGIHNAEWVIAGCQRSVGGVVERGRGGLPVTWLMLIPASEVELLDTWHTIGLCGTGSTDFVVDGAFVPARRAIRLDAPPPHPTPLLAFSPFTFLAMGIGAVALGLAAAALDDVTALANEKRPEGTLRLLAERPATQGRVARAYASVRAARAFLGEAVDGLWEEAQRDAAVPMAARRDVRLATTHAVRAAARAVDDCYELAGGTAVYRRSRLSRIVRDVHVVTQHVMVGAGTFELAGRLLLGLDTDTAML